MNESPPPPSAEVLQRYWKANVRILSFLLVIWAAVSFGGGIVFVEPLNAVRIGEAKLGFWIAQQGSIYAFVALTGVYVVLSNRLERRFGLREA